MVSSRFGEVDSIVTGASINSSSRFTYLIACAGKYRPGPRALGRSLPALQHLVNRLDPRLRTLRSRQIVDLMPIQPVADADFHFVEPVEHVQLRQRDAVDAAHLHRLAHQAGVEPAAAAWPAGHCAELMAALAEKPADLIDLLGGEGPLTHAGGIGLGDAEHMGHRTRTKTRTRCRLCRNRIGRGHERVSPVIDVEHRSLGALEQDPPAVAALLIEELPDAIDIGQHVRRDARKLLEQCVTRNLLNTEAAPQRIMVSQRPVDLGPERFHIH